MRAVVLAGRNATARALVAAVVVALSAACAAAGDGESMASCEFRVEYDKRVYSDVVNAEFRVGEKLGTAVLPPCNDTPDDEGSRASPDSTAVYAVEGVDPGVAIAVDDAPEDVLFVLKSLEGDLPSEVKKLIKGS